LDIYKTRKSRSTEVSNSSSRYVENSLRRSINLKPQTVYQSSSTLRNEVEQKETAKTDELDELCCNEKWVRSAPDELYYERNHAGYII